MFTSREVVRRDSGPLEDTPNPIPHPKVDLSKPPVAKSSPPQIRSPKLPLKSDRKIRQAHPCSSLRLSFWPLKPCGNMRTCAHPLPWKPAHAFRCRLTHSNKHKTSRQTKAWYIPQSQPKADWPRRATRSVYNKPYN